jgi:hypothetical protein
VGECPRESVMDDSKWIDEERDAHTVIWSWPRTKMIYIKKRVFNPQDYGVVVIDTFKDAEKID